MSAQKVRSFVKAWHPLPGATLRFRLRFVASLRLQLVASSGLFSAALFGFLICCLISLKSEAESLALCIFQVIELMLSNRRNNWAACAVGVR